MTILLTIVAVALLVSFLIFLLKSKRLEGIVRQRDAEVASAKQESERVRKHYESEAQRIYNESQQVLADGQKRMDEQRVALEQESRRLQEQYEVDTRRARDETKQALENAQRLVVQQRVTLDQEKERIRRHYEQEAQRVQGEANAALAKARQDAESLRKYQALQNAEADVQRVLTDAINEATALRKEAQALLEQARLAATTERETAIVKARDIHEQADARLNQALRDAGRIVADAEKRAEQIGGDAYTALREKETLEQAAEAMRNIVEGYGDRYLVPAHSLLDDLAAEYGYDAAGQSLASAREQSKRMTEQGEAAACDYVEASRRNTAIQFVIHAFNGSVDATLSRVKSDNYGVLEQRIRDCYSIVNRDGSAFRNARILPAYLDARLAELKWAVVVRELERQRQEQQRAIDQERRDTERAKRQAEREAQEAENEEKRMRAAREAVLNDHEKALAELRAQLEKANEQQRIELEKKIEQNEASFKAQLQEKDEQVRLAEEMSQRAKSNAEKGIRHGHVYIISNIGSFNREDVFKIGLTRREDWNERIEELGDASVPFKFDVHGILESNNAPELEKKLHVRFMAKRLNKLSGFCEFFRVSLTEIFEEIDKLKQGEDFTVKVRTMSADAQLWRESQQIDNDPQELEKWLAREKAQVERRFRLNALRASMLDDAVTGSHHD